MSQTRSPLKHPAQRIAGQSVREQLLAVWFDQAGNEIIAAFCVILAMMEWIRWPLRAVPGWRSCTLYTAIAIVAVLIALRKRRGSERRIANLQQGLEGEIAVGQFLDEYCRQRGYAVIHDLKADAFNVDHILIGQGGVFAIETKTLSFQNEGRSAQCGADSWE